MATAFPEDDNYAGLPGKLESFEATEGGQAESLESTVLMERNVVLDAATLKDLLESNWSKLVNCLEVERILPKLRDAYLFDKADQQRIGNESRYPAAVDKAGALLDKVVERGPKAIQILFDHVEKRHPDLYKEITGKEPRITRERMATILKDRQRGCLPPGLTMTILNQLTEMLGDKEKQEEELSRQHRELEEHRKAIKKLRFEKNKLLNKNEALLSKVQERDKLHMDLNERNAMLESAQSKALKYQRQAEKAKHHARMATFKNFHLEYELKEMSNSRNLERRKTRNLQQSVKNHEALLNKQNITGSYNTFDPRKVEELQRELEKIDDFRRSVASDGEVYEISERVKNQLEQARDTNEGLNLKLRRAQEKSEKLEGDISLMKKECKMMRDTQRMNRLHLEMAQQELEIVSQERAKLNQAYGEVLKDRSQLYLSNSSLQEKLNRLRLDYADLSDRVMNASDGSVDSSGIFVQRVTSVDTLYEEDDTGAEAEDETESGVDDDTKDHEIVPLRRPRLQRLISSGRVRRNSADQMKMLSESFDKGESSSSNSHTMTSSSTTTTGDEDPTASPAIGRIAGFPTYSLCLSGSEEEEDDEEDEDIARRISRLDDDFLFIEHQTEHPSVRSRQRSRRSPGLDEHRRSRSLSRLGDYENMEFMEQAHGCYSFFTKKTSLKKKVQNLLNSSSYQ